MSIRKFYLSREKPKQTDLFATVYESQSHTARLMFDGVSSPTTKFYPCMTEDTLHLGDRVKVLRKNGTYIIEYLTGGTGGGGITTFEINGTEYNTLLLCSFTAWIASDLNTAGYTRIYKYGLYFLSLDGETLDASLDSGSSNVEAGRNYVIEKMQFQINGTAYNGYKNITGNNWINTEDNTDGYTFTYYNGAYWFTQASQRVAKFATSSSAKIEAGHNYTAE